MFQSRNLNSKINRIHEGAHRLVCQNNLSFSELLDLDNSVTVHQTNFQVLVTEIYKVENSSRDNERHFRTTKSFV